MVGLVGASVVLALLPLALILANLVVKGVGSLDWAFFTRMPAPTGQEGGGVAHAIVGTLLIVGAASLIGLPLGIAAGIYCAEYPGTRLATVTRFVVAAATSRRKRSAAPLVSPSTTTASLELKRTSLPSALRSESVGPPAFRPDCATLARRVVPASGSSTNTPADSV